MDEYNNIFAVDSAIEQILQAKNLEGPHTSSMQDLTDRGRASNALPLPVQAGTRVRFLANLGSVLTYDKMPESDVEGTVILIKSAEGKKTAHDGLVFVSWDDGQFRPIMAQHLRPAKGNKRMARNVALKVADISFISDHFSVHSSSTDELVHRATKDLWSFRGDDDGFIIERLFDGSGEPLKV